MNRETFLKELKAQFPEAYSNIDDIDQGLLHLEMSAFRRWVESELATGGAWNCEKKAFKFIEICLKRADSSLENAIEISFIEYLALGEHDMHIKKIVIDRAPKSIREKMEIAHEFWK